MSSIAEKVAEIIAYYKNLLIIQYHAKARATADIELFITRLLADGLFLKLERAFDINSAVGPALTNIGKYVGVPRDIWGYELDENYLSLIDGNDPVADDAIGFFDTSADMYPDGSIIFGFESKISKFTINDSQLRLLIQLAIIANNSSRSTFKAIKDNMYNFFPDVIIDDNQDMSLTSIINNTFSEVVKLAIYLNIFIPPSCVSLIKINTDISSEVFYLLDGEQTVIDQVEGFFYDDGGNIMGGDLLDYTNFF